MIGKDKKQTIYWTLQIGGWGFYAFVHFILLLIDDQEKIRLISVLSIVLTAAYFLISSHVYRQLVIRMGWLNKRLIDLVPRVIGSAFILGMTWYVFEIVLSSGLGTLNPSQDFEPFRILVLIIAAMAWYLLWASVYFLYHYVEKTNASLKYEAAIFEIELNQLKSQLNPHFIFNALNSIRALVDEDPDKSKTAITQLSNILRNSLVVNRRKLIDLKDEIKTVMDYLALESVRFEERLSVFYNIDPATTSCQVPPLMLQTLVENGIKHGISKLTYGGQIRISARINEDNNLEIEIRNSGQFSGNGSSGTTGLGIENTRRRLDLLYGSRSQFQIRNEDDATVLTRIIIPQSVMYESIDRR